MKRLLRYMAVLAFIAAFFTLTGGISAHAATTHQMLPQTPGQCSQSSASVEIDSLGANYYYCGTGYTGLNIKPAYSVYNYTSLQVWFRWYATGQVPYGQYCWLGSHSSASFVAAGYNDTLLTQLNIGGLDQGSQCPA